MKRSFQQGGHLVNIDRLGVDILAGEERTGFKKQNGVSLTEFVSSYTPQDKLILWGEGVCGTPVSRCHSGKDL